MPYKKMTGLGQVSKKELEVLKKAKPKTNKGLGQISAQEMNMIRKYRMNINKKPK